MSTLTIDKTGKTIGYNIQWCEDGRRHSIYLGGLKYSKKTAETCQECIDALLYYKRNGIITPDRKVEDWLQSAPAHLRSKLAAAGLYAIPETKTWQEIWSLFLEDRKDFKPSTLGSYRSCQKNFYKTFSPADCISELTSKDLLDWKLLLGTEHNLGGVEGHLKVINTILQWAIKCGWLTTNPMKNVPRKRVFNREHHRFISMTEYAKLLDACPNQEWRTIIALARIGGLRCPSEIQHMRWSDINWAESQFLVRSSKTERHDWHRERTVPLFDGLREELQRLFDLVKPNDNDFVIQHQGGNWHLCYKFKRIAVAAGLGNITYPFTNMRRSRCNEVLEAFGDIRESVIMGHSLRVMKNHYLMLSSDDYAKMARQV